MRAPDGGGAADLRRARRIIAGLLIAAGAPTPAERARADDALGLLGWPALAQPDFVRETPEALAQAVPDELRLAMLHILYDLAGDEPIRLRLAEAYAGLWAANTVPDIAPDPTPRRGGGIARWLIGQLPRHHIGRAAKEDDMV